MKKPVKRKPRRERVPAHTRTIINFKCDPALSQLVRDSAEQRRVSESWLIKDCLYKVLVEGCSNNSNQNTT